MHGGPGQWPDYSEFPGKYVPIRPSAQDRSKKGVYHEKNAIIIKGMV